MKLQKTDDKNSRSYLISLIVVLLVAFFYSYEAILTKYPLTQFLQGLSEGAEVAIATIFSIAVYAIFLHFAWKDVSGCKNATERKLLQYLWMALLIILVVTYSAKKNLGRGEVIALLLAVLSARLISSLQEDNRRLLWLIPLLSLVAECLTKEYIFLYFPIVLLLLLDKKSEVKRVENENRLESSCDINLKEFYKLLNAVLIITVLSTALLCLSFNLSGKGLITTADFLDNNRARIRNVFKLLIFLPLSIPFFRIAVKFGQHYKNHYLYLLPILNIPFLIIDTDFYRWYMAMAVFNLVFLIEKVRMQNFEVCSALMDTIKEIKKSPLPYFLLIIYGMAFVGYGLNYSIGDLFNLLNENVLMLW